MKKLMAAALFAATALPGLAQAQEWRGGDRHPVRGEDRTPDAPRPAPQPQQARPQPASGAPDGGHHFDRGQPLGVAPQPQSFQRPEGRSFDGGRRFDRGQQFNGAPLQAQPFRPDGRGDRGQPFNGAQGQPQPFAHPDARFDRGQRFDGDPRRGDRGHFDGEAQQRSGDRVFDAQRHGYAPAYRPDQARNAYRYDGGRAPFTGGYRTDDDHGQWNRGWRADRRYDWSGYRRGHDELFRLPHYSAPYGWRYGYQRFGVGVVIDEGLFAPDYWIDDPYEYRLPPVDGPYRWVRYYGDALLVDIYTGEVVDTVYGIFG